MTKDYLSASELSNITRGLINLQYRTEIQLNAELKALINPLVKSIRQRDVQQIVKDSVIPKLTPGYHISQSTLRVSKAYQLKDALKVIHQLNSQNESLKTTNKVIQILTQAQAFYLHQPSTLSNVLKPNENWRLKYLVKDTLPLLTYQGLKLPANTSIFSIIDPDDTIDTYRYTNQHIVLTNLQTTNSQPVYSIDDLAKAHHVNTAIILQFCYLIGLTIDDFIIQDNQIKFTSTFTKKLDQYLK